MGFLRLFLSREARKLGIKTGTGVYKARRICPKIILVPADFGKYFSVTKTADLFGGINGLTKKIKENIRDEIGEYITCSIGISYNRLLAKLDSDVNKPNGIFEITPENRDEVLFSRKLSDVCGRRA